MTQRAEELESELESEFELEGEQELELEGELEDEFEGFLSQRTLGADRDAVLREAKTLLAAAVAEGA